MRRKTQIVLVITFMVAAMVACFSYLYVSLFLRQRVNTASEIAQLLTRQIRATASADLTRTDNARSVRAAIEEYLKRDTNVNEMLDTVVGEVPFVLDAAVVDLEGRALLHSNADLVGKVVQHRPDFETLHQARFLDQVRMIYSPLAVYDETLDLTLNKAPFGTVRVGVSTVLLRSELTPQLRNAVLLVAVVFCLLAALIATRYCLLLLRRSLDAPCVVLFTHR